MNKKIKIMKKIFFFTAIFFLTLSCCQKDIAYTSEDRESISSTRSDHGPINTDKQDRKILFVSNRDGNDEIYAMNIDGSNVVRLTYNNVPDGRATWSANGQHTAFASGAPGLKDIYVMNANGSGL
jgi:Tol biopolymer transport system component